jgi:hypothetical protein
MAMASDYADAERDDPASKSWYVAFWVPRLTRAFAAEGISLDNVLLSVLRQTLSTAELMDSLLDSPNNKDAALNKCLQTVLALEDRATSMGTPLANQVHMLATSLHELPELRHEIASGLKIAVFSSLAKRSATRLDEMIGILTREGGATVRFTIAPFARASRDADIFERLQKACTHLVAGGILLDCVLDRVEDNNNEIFGRTITRFDSAIFLVVGFGRWAAALVAAPRFSANLMFADVIGTLRARWTIRLRKRCAELGR